MDHMLWLEAIRIHYSLQNYGKLSSLEPLLSEHPQEPVLWWDAL